MSASSRRRNFLGLINLMLVQVNLLQMLKTKIIVCTYIPLMSYFFKKQRRKKDRQTENA